MSRPYLTWDPALDAWLPGGTIAFHKDLLGWIPRERTLTVSDAADVRVRLDPHTAGSEGGGTLLVRVPIPGTPDFYTIEARRRLGYDRGVPAEAVVLHRVPDPDGPDCTLHRCAEVVDRYANTGRLSALRAGHRKQSLHPDRHRLTVLQRGLVHARRRRLLGPPHHLGCA